MIFKLKVIVGFVGFDIDIFLGLFFFVYRVGLGYLGGMIDQGEGSGVGRLGQKNGIVFIRIYK